MNVELLRLNLVEKLTQHFNVQSVTSRIIDSSRIRNAVIQDKYIVEFEFIINKKERYFTFATECSDRGVMFTRPKEGMSQYLIPEIRIHDFRYYLTDKIEDHTDLIGRFIETWIGFKAASDIRSLLKEHATVINPDADYCMGYKITTHHKHAKTYDGYFEVSVRKGNKDKYECFTGEIRDAKLYAMYDKEKNQVSMEDIFGD